MRRPTVLLFDIDGTLVSTGGVGSRAIRRAFEALHRRPDACAFPFDGMTDRAIARRGLTAVGASADEADIDAVLQRYLDELDREVQQADQRQFRVHAGMREAIAAGHAAGCAVGLGTGNVRRGAMLKLGPVGLSGSFSFGGFGDDHELRPELIRIGADRGAATLGVARAEVRVVIIGDTPKDIDAAKAIGAECIAVGTGAWKAAALREHGATAAFDDLSAPGALAALLGG